MHVSENVLLKNVYVISSIVLIQVTTTGCTNTSTVCFGAPGQKCTEHNLSCPSPLVIQIINTTYGYRPGCNDIGISDCTDTTCCNEEPEDCFVPFSSEDVRLVEENCTYAKSCKLIRFRRYNTTHIVCDGSVVSAYSKVEYDCITEDSSLNTSISTTYSGTTTIASTDSSITTSTPTTYSGTTTIASMDSSIPTSTPTTYSGTTTIASMDSSITTSTPTTYSGTTTIASTGQDSGNTSNVGSIVGGLFGAVIIIVIIIVVVVFLYKRRKNSQTPLSTDTKITIETVTPQYHVIDGPGTINNRKDTSGYDEIELDGKPRVPTTDNYDHVGDEALKIQSSKEHDNYNHIGAHNHSVHEDNYHHIGNNLSSSANHFESDYNHINGVRGTFNDADDYNHIGDNDNKKVITDDNYHHIGSEDINVEGDYDHIHDDNDLAHSDSNNVDASEAPYNFATC